MLPLHSAALVFIIMGASAQTNNCSSGSLNEYIDIRQRWVLKEQYDTFIIIQYSSIEVGISYD